MTDRVSDDKLRAVIEAGEKAKELLQFAHQRQFHEQRTIRFEYDNGWFAAYVTPNDPLMDYVIEACNFSPQAARELLELREKAAKMEKDNADLRQRLALLTEKRANDILSEWW